MKNAAKPLLISFLLVGLVCGIVLIANMNPTEIISSGGRRGWQNIVSADGDGGPLAAGESGFCYFMVYPHQAAPGTAYASNLTNASAYEVQYYLDQEMTGETPYGHTFNFVLKIRVNTTVGYNTSSSSWMSTWVRCLLSVNFDYRADISNAAMTVVEITHTATYAWYHLYLNNGGAGYTITKNEKFNCTILAQGYY